MFPKALKVTRNPHEGGTFSEEKIDEKTGKMMLLLSGHYAPAPRIQEDVENQEIFVEITN